jgi:hypothetical protein
MLFLGIFFFSNKRKEKKKQRKKTIEKKMQRKEGIYLSFRSALSLLTHFWPPISALLFQVLFPWHLLLLE